MSSRIVFECVGGMPVPVLAQARDGVDRTIDGIRFLSAEQVAERFNVDPGTVADAHGICIGDLMDYASPAVSSTESIIRKMYDYLDADQYALFREECRRLGFNLLGKGLWPKFQHNDATGSMELKVQLSADGFFAIAHRTGEFMEFIGPHWCMDDKLEWRDVAGHGLPFAARAGVRRKGMDQPIFAVAKWDAYAPFTLDRGKKIYSEFWERMPDFMLGKCVSCLAIRRTWPEHFTNVYGPEEMAFGGDRPAGGRTRPPSAPMKSTLDYGGADADISTHPQTPAQFMRAVFELNFRDTAHRNDTLEELKTRWAVLHGQNLRGWYMEVLKELRSNPTRYGIENDAA